MAKRPPVLHCAPNVVDVAAGLNPNALLVAVAVDGPNSEGVVPNDEPNPPPAPNPVAAPTPKAGVVDVDAVLPNPPNPNHENTSHVDCIMLLVWPFLLCGAQAWPADVEFTV